MWVSPRLTALPPFLCQGRIANEVKTNSEHYLCDKYKCPCRGMSCGPRETLSLLLSVTLICVCNRERCQRYKEFFSFISFLFQKETRIFKHYTNIQSNFLRNATGECFPIIFFVWNCFISSRDNDQIGGFVYTPWVTVPWCLEGCDTPHQLIPRH